MEQGEADTDKQAPSRIPGVVAVIAVIAVAAGIALRTIELTRNRPLWLDEAMLGLNIASRSVLDLARPLDYDQSAPLLYLWLERLAVLLGGVSERSLRFLPFVAGVALVPLTWIAVRRLAGTATALVTTVLVALSVSLVSFSAEAKQYGVDPLATLIAVGLAARVVATPEDRRAWTRLTIGGAVCLVLSQPAAFVLGGIALALAAERSVRAAPAVRRRMAVAGITWGATFLALYLGLYRSTSQSSYMRHFWEGTFLDPSAPDFFLRLRLFDIAAFSAPLLGGHALGVAGLLALAWSLGVLTLWRRSRFGAVVVSVPLVLAAFATAFGQYAVMDRLFLFAAPLTLMAYACVVVRVIDRVPANVRTIALGGACAALAGIVAPTHARRVAEPVFYAVGKQVIADVDSLAQAEPVYVAARSFPLWVYYTTDWRAPDVARLHWAAKIARAGGPAHNNAPSRVRVRSADTTTLVRRYRGRTEIVGLPTGRQYLTTTRTLDPALAPFDYAVPSRVDAGWAELEVQRMTSAARPRLWLFGSHMFALDGAEPALVAELQRRGVRLLMERRQGSTVAYWLEFPAYP
jgi:hypothetical protein